MKKAVTTLNTSTESPSGNFGSYAIWVVLLTALGACDAPPKVPATGKVIAPSAATPLHGCDHEMGELVDAVLNDSVLRESSHYLFESNDRPIIVLGGVRPLPRACESVKREYSIYTSDESMAIKPRNYVAVTSAFHDADAGYIRLSLHPSQLRGEFFLKKKSGVWSVSDRVIWKE